MPWNKNKPRTDINGPKSPRWKGGKYISSDGYRMVKVAERFDCNSPWKSYRREHTHVMETFIGRKLNKGEIVHHLDKDKLNNSLCNLFLTDQKQHRAIHDTLENLSIELYKKSFIIFNTITKNYEFTEEFKKLCKLD